MVQVLEKLALERFVALDHLFEVLRIGECEIPHTHTI